MTPLIVNKEEEGEHCDDEAGDDEHHHDQAAVHLPLLHHQANIKDTDEDFKDTAWVCIKDTAKRFSFQCSCRWLSINRNSINYIVLSSSHFFGKQYISRKEKLTNLAINRARSWKFQRILWKRYMTYNKVIWPEIWKIIIFLRLLKDFSFFIFK